MSGPNPLDAVPFMAVDLDRVEDLLALSASSGDPYLTEICSHLVAAGGKRVRPGFCLAAAATSLCISQQHHKRSDEQGSSLCHITPDGSAMIDMYMDGWVDACMHT